MNLQSKVNPCKDASSLDICDILAGFELQFSQANQLLEKLRDCINNDSIREYLDSAIKYLKFPIEDSENILLATQAIDKILFLDHPGNRWFDETRIILLEVLDYLRLPRLIANFAGLMDKEEILTKALDAISERVTVKDLNMNYLKNQERKESLLKFLYEMEQKGALKLGPSREAV